MVSSTGGGVAVREPPPQLVSKGTVSNAESITASRRETILRSLYIVFIVFPRQPAFAKSRAVAKIEFESLLFRLELKKHSPLIYNSVTKAFDYYLDPISQVIHPAFERNGIHP
jgi:hypothetical protein